MKCSRPTCTRLARIGKRLCSKCAETGRLRRHRQRNARRRGPKRARSDDHRARLCASNCARLAYYGNTYCNKCRDAARRREARRLAKLNEPPRYCGCGALLTPTNRGGVCRGCLGRIALEKLRKREASNECHACSGVGHRQVGMTLAQAAKAELVCRSCSGTGQRVVTAASAETPWRDEGEEAAA